MKGYGQFCPVAKTAEIFAQRWTPLIVRELCFGPKRFTEVHGGVPLMSRALLVQRLAELEEAGVIATEPLAQGKLYRLTPAGEHLGGIVNLMSDWGQRHGQGRIAHEELDPTLLMWGMRRQIAQSELPDHPIVLRLEFRGIPRAFAARRYWWMIVRSDDVEVCLKDPGVEVDVVLAADLEAFVRVWMGHRGLAEAVETGDITLSGPSPKVTELKRVLRLSEAPTLRILAFPPAADGRPPITDDVGQKDTEWWEPGLVLARMGGEVRTSWIVDPADGRLPYTEQGARLLAAAQKADLERFEGPEARPAAERCLIGGGGVSGAPMLNGAYNSNYQIVQTREHVVIVTEMIRAARIVPLKPTAPLPAAMRPWTGDPVGRWEGDTLVVETRGFNPGLAWRAPARFYLSPEARVTERFKRVSANEIRYDFAVDDPAMFSRPWRAEMVLRPATGAMHEYACHEGNYALSGVLAGGRRQEREAAEATR